MVRPLPAGHLLLPSTLTMTNRRQRPRVLVTKSHLSRARRTRPLVQPASANVGPRRRVKHLSSVAKRCYQRISIQVRRQRFRVTLPPELLPRVLVLEVSQPAVHRLFVQVQQLEDRRVWLSVPNSDKAHRQPKSGTF
ncbi:unnamed protein product [Dibothriocephalus latus]|uniref:Uncharacterized protein n=1 Tax=Dibothriocephalus latus TaxID=60516 RepID=A0A3P7MR91_DIBLA|nr:unnamed protein product [Dibothriocephalus latus]